MMSVSGAGPDEFEAYLDSTDWQSFCSSRFDAKEIPRALRAIRHARKKNEADLAADVLEAATEDDATGTYLPAAVPVVVALFMLLKSAPENLVRLTVLDALGDYFAIEQKPWWPAPDDMGTSAVICRILRSESATYEALLSDPDPMVRSEALAALAVVDPDRDRAANRMAQFERDDQDPEIQRVIGYVRGSHWWRSLQDSTASASPEEAA